MSFFEDCQIVSYTYQLKTGKKQRRIHCLRDSVEKVSVWSANEKQKRKPSDEIMFARKLDFSGREYSDVSRVTKLEEIDKDHGVEKTSD